MSNIDNLIGNIDPKKKKNPSRSELWTFVQESLAQIGQINEVYKKYFEKPAEGENIALFDEVEARLQKLEESYTDLFTKGEGGISKVVELKKQIEEIQQYHAVLLDGDGSVKSSIEEAQERITKFYEYLFGDDNVDGIQPEVKEAITTILSSKKTITDFEAHLNQKIKPTLKEIQDDLDLKRREVNALLSQATANTLAEAYAESKYEYSIPPTGKYEDGKWFRNTDTFISNTIGRYAGFLFNYTLFILPLVSVSLIFINERVADIILASLARGGVAPSATELIYVKTIISIPLVWIAWYGQRNLTQRKRLTEEYNHKLRVVQMYLMFITNETSYKLKNKARLEKVLLDAVERNPSEVYGHDETLLDKIANIFQARKDQVEEVVKEAVDTTGGV